MIDPFEHPMTKELLAGLMARSIDARSVFDQATADIKEGRFSDSMVKFAALAMLGNCTAGPEAPQTIMFLGNLAESLRGMGELDTTRNLQAQVLIVQEREFGIGDPRTIITMRNFALTLKDLGELEASRILRERILHIQRAKHQHDSPEVVESMGQLADLLREMDEFVSAAELYRSIVKIQQKSLEHQQRETLSSKQQLAINLIDIGEIITGVKMLEDTLETSARDLGSDDPCTLFSMRNLAVALQKLGDLDSAKRMNQQSVQSHILVLGRQHEDTLSAMSNLAEVMRESGELESARRIQEETLDLRRRALPPNHPDTIISMNNLASILADMGKLDDATRMQEQVVDMSVSVHRRGSTASMMYMSNLAELLREAGEYDGAKEIHKDVLEMRTQKLGKRHPDTLVSINNLALTLRQLGDHDTSIRLFGQTLRICQRTLGIDHPMTLTRMNNLATALGYSGNLGSAKSILERTIALSSRKLGSEHPLTIMYMHNLASTLFYLGERMEAEQQLAARFVAIERRRSNANGTIAQAKAGGYAGFANSGVELACVRAWLRRSACDVFRPLSSVTGRICLDILDRGGVDVLLQAERALQSQRFIEFETAWKRDRTLTRCLYEYEARVSSIELQMAAAQSRGAEAHADGDSDGVNQAANDLEKLQERLELTQTQAREARAEQSRVQEVILGFEREIFPQARPRSLEEVREVLEEGEVLLVMGITGTHGIAMTISGDSRQATEAFVLSDAQYSLSIAEACGTLFAMGFQPHDSEAYRCREALRVLLKQDSALPGPISASVLEDCRERVNALVRISRHAAEFPDDAIRERVPTLPFETMQALANVVMSILFPKAVRKAIASAERLIIVPAGSLTEIPLELLGSYSDASVLFDKPIVYTPSPSLLVFTRQQDRDQDGTFTSRGAALFGDPDFEQNEDPEELDRSLGSMRTQTLTRMYGGLGRLPCSGQEIADVHRIFEKRGEPSEPLTGPDATVTHARSKLRGKKLQYIHLASHGRSNPQDVTLSGVAMSRPGSLTADDPGWLLLKELLSDWGGSLTGCKLMTLSACETTRGVQVGDSLVSLPLGLLHTGVRLVMASLWKVPDAATWLLMRRFYENLLGTRLDDSDVQERSVWSGKATGAPGRPMSPSASLAEAQSWLKSLPRSAAEAIAAEHEVSDEARETLNRALRASESDRPFEHPINWAAFILVGDEAPQR